MDFPFHHSDQVLFLPGATRGLFVTRWRSPERGPGWLVASDPVETLVAIRLDEVRGVLERAAAHPFAAGYLAYEAAPAFDASLPVHEPGPEPLAAFHLYAEPPAWHRALSPTAAPARVVRAEPAVSPKWYRSQFDRVKGWLEDGTVYQVNLTFPLDVMPVGDPWALFVALNAVSPAPYASFLDTPHQRVLSFSPELFFEMRGDRVRCRPMKGTARRLADPVADREAAQALLASEKERAENLMIVDMVRNDLGRIAEVGSVQVDSLFEVERYPTVWQMTSEVSARTPEGLPEVFRALFPGASVTGAPKGSAMGVLRSLEVGPRGVYTGALGFSTPGYARFGLPIRTLTINGSVRCPVGSGVVWDSVADREWSECLDKGAHLTAPGEPLGLLETLRWEPGEGFALLDRHLARLSEAAQTFGVPLDMAAVEAELHLAVEGTGGAQRVRLTVDLEGKPRAEATDLGKSGPITARVSKVPVVSGDPLLMFKTTLRDAYAAPTDTDDVLQANERGELTEFTIGNLVVEREGRFFTPPLSSGVLEGTLRAQLLEEGVLVESVLLEDDLKDANVYRINSVRGWQSVSLVGIAG